MVPPSGAVSSFTGRHAPALSAPPPPPIEDRPAVPSLASVRPSPFPGPISLGKGYGKAPPVVPGQSPDSLPVTNDHLLPVSAPRLDEDRTHLQKSYPSYMHPPTSGDRLYGVIDRWFTDKGYGFITADIGGDDVFLHKSAMRRKTTLRPNRPGYHIRKPLIPKSRNSRLTPSVSSLRVTPLLGSANRLVHILAPLHVRAASFPTADVHVSHRFPSAGSVA